MKRAQELRAAAGPRADEPVNVTVQALLLAGAYPLIPPDKVPPSVRNPGALYGEFTPVTLLQGVGEAGQAALALGTAALKAVSRVLGGGSSDGAPAPAAENGPARSVSADGGAARPGSAPAPSPTAAAGATAAAKPRRQPPPPPPKM